MQINIALSVDATDAVMHRSMALNLFIGCARVHNNDARPVTLTGSDRDEDV